MKTIYMDTNWNVLSNIHWQSRKLSFECESLVLNCSIACNTPSQRGGMTSWKSLQMLVVIVFKEVVWMHPTNNEAVLHHIVWKPFETLVQCSEWMHTAKKFGADYARNYLTVRSQSGHVQLQIDRDVSGIQKIHFCQGCQAIFKQFPGQLLHLTLFSFWRASKTKKQISILVLGRHK